MWLGMVENSLSPILFPSKSDMQYIDLTEPSPLLIIFLLVVTDLYEELGSVYGHEIGVGVSQTA